LAVPLRRRCGRRTGARSISERDARAGGQKR
jgi:hypothetical protein